MKYFNVFIYVIVFFITSCQSNENYSNNNIIDAIKRDLDEQNIKNINSISLIYDNTRKNQIDNIIQIKFFFKKVKIHINLRKCKDFDLDEYLTNGYAVELDENMNNYIIIDGYFADTKEKFRRKYSFCKENKNNLTQFFKKLE